MDLGCQFNYLPVVRQIHRGRMTASKSFDREGAGLIEQFKSSDAVKRTAPG